MQGGAGGGRSGASGKRAGEAETTSGRRGRGVGVACGLHVSAWAGWGKMRELGWAREK
jgi:hypothetical protein